MNIARIAAIALLSTAAAAALAQGSATAEANKAPAAAQSASAPAATSDAEKTICRNEKPMGSLIPKRVCKTAAQWDAEREQARKMMQDMQQRTGSTSGR